MSSNSDEVWVDIITGHRLYLSKYNHSLIYNDVCMKVELEHETSLDKFIWFNRLEQVFPTKEGLISIIKAYVKNIKVIISENHGDNERIEKFKKGSNQMAKQLLSKFDELKVLNYKNAQASKKMGGFCFSYSDEIATTLLLFSDGYRKENQSNKL